MDFIVGHTNMDLDCIGCMVLAKYLYPGHTPIKSHLIHPAARKLMNLYEDKLGFASLPEVKGQKAGHVVVVDARTPDKIAEYLKGLDAANASFEVWDHHPPSSRDIKEAAFHDGKHGAGVTQLCIELRGRNISPSPVDATIALTGLYADTGNFIHDTVTIEDLEAAAFLFSNGASLNLVRDFITPLREKSQQVLFHDILNGLHERHVRGHLVQSCYMELEEDSQGMGAVMEQVFSVEQSDILIGCFFFKPKGKMLIIARSRAPDIKLNELLQPFGGGGHPQAASATIKTEDGLDLVRKLDSVLEEILKPAPTAADIMNAPVDSVKDSMLLVDASRYMETSGRTGVPVLDDTGSLAGFLTLRDIMTGRKANQMHVPVRSFMSKKPIAVPPDATVRVIDAMMAEHNIGHLPVAENGVVVGMVTRSDYLAYRKGENSAKERMLERLGIQAEPA